MHEMALAQDVLRKVLKAAAETKLQKVSLVKVNIGETRVSDKAELVELFAQVSKGTAADEAKLIVTVMPLMAFCKSCKKDFSAGEMKKGCPKCESEDFEIVSGKEVLITEIK
jgi:hydrogenase nickel incorporation protein HypA/HybF